MVAYIAISALLFPLLFSACRKETSPESNGPKPGKRDYVWAVDTLATGARETLNVSFDRQLLWLRYHPTETQIVYSNYPRGAGGSTVATDSEIGVIDRHTLNKRILDVNTNPGWLSVSVFPNWSPDGKHIVYGSAPGPAKEPPGAKGAYSLYILWDVN